MSKIRDGNMKDGDITRGTTNVFDNLGFPDTAERQTKTRLALAVRFGRQLLADAAAMFWMGKGGATAGVHGWSVNQAGDERPP